MWTPAARAELPRESLPYATCLTDAELSLVGSLLAGRTTTGRPWRWSMCSVLYAILYALRTGCTWQHLPLDVPRWLTVYRWFLRLSQALVFERLAHTLTIADRERVGREASPSGYILDAKAARSGGVGIESERGYDPARSVVGRKRHAPTDTAGRIQCSEPEPLNYLLGQCARIERQFSPPA